MRCGCNKIPRNPAIVHRSLRVVRLVYSPLLSLVRWISQWRKNDVDGFRCFVPNTLPERARQGLRHWWHPSPGNVWRLRSEPGGLFFFVFVFVGLVRVLVWCSRWPFWEGSFHAMLPCHVVQLTRVVKQPILPPISGEPSIPNSLT